MGKVKKVSTTSEAFSKSLKKSQSAIQSIKSPTSRRKSIATVLPTPLKPKKSKDARKSLGVLETINQDIPPRETKQRKSKTKATENQKYKNANSSNFEDKFSIKIKDIEAAVEGVIKLHTENPKVKNQLFDSEAFPLSIMINCHKIPTGNQRILRIPLTHTLHTADDDVCLIVSEVKGIGNKELEKHVEHYEKLLAEKGVTNIKKIMTVHELKTEYETFEQKARLVDLYDRFLVCGKVSGKVVKKCGKVFYKKRKVPTAVKLQITKLKEHIDKQLSKAHLHLHLKGDSYNVQFGHSHMDVLQLVENFVSVVEFLDKEFPGQFINIKGLHITAPRASSIPVYISTRNPTEIPKVKANPQNKNKPKAVKGELTTQLNSEVLVKPSGQVVVLREKPLNSKRKKEEVEGAENNENEEVPKKKLKQNKKKLEKTVTDSSLTKKEKLDKKKKKKTEEIESSVESSKLKSKKKIGEGVKIHKIKKTVKPVLDTNEKIDKKKKKTKGVKKSEKN